MLEKLPIGFSADLLTFYDGHLGLVGIQNKMLTIYQREKDGN